MCTHKTLLLLCLALFAASVNAGAVSQRLCSVNSVAGCNTHSMCAHLTNGQCEQHDGQCGYQCSCQAGWEGDKCDQKMACDTDLCNGNGTPEGNKVDGCTCMCDEGFAGDRCEIAADEEFVVVDEAANGVDGTGWSNTKVGKGTQHHTNTNMHGPWGSDVRSVERTFQIGSNTCGAPCTVSWVQYGEHTRDNEWDRVYVNDVEVGSEQMYHSTRTQKAGTWTGACSNALTLRFTSDLDQALSDEGWGFGGVKVVRHACTATIDYAAAAFRLDAGDSKDTTNVKDLVSGGAMTWHDGSTKADATINGHAAWDMKNKHMQKSGVPLTKDATLFVVSEGVETSKYGTWGSLFHLGGRDNDLALEQMANAGKMNWQTCNDNGSGLITYGYGVPELWVGRITSAGIRTFRRVTAKSDGTQNVESETMTGQNCITAGNKDVWVGGSHINEMFNGKLGEMVYYNKALSDAELDNMQAALFAKWLAPE